MSLSIPQAPLTNLFMNLALGLVMSLILSWYYSRFGRSLSNRTLLAAMLPVLSLTVLMLIADSRAATGLKLGVLSSLAVIRFRTAIRDPEEILFILLAAVIGLGLAVAQQLAVLAAFALVMVILLARDYKKWGYRYSHNLYLDIDLQQQSDVGILDKVNQILQKDASFKCKLRRRDRQGSTLHVTYNLDIGSQKTLLALMDRLKSEFPDSSISFVEQNNLSGSMP